MEENKILQFWNEQASLLEKAGSKDLIAKELEVVTISNHVNDGMKVCEFGCGNGFAAISIAKKYDVNMKCYDFSPEMIAAAKPLAAEAGVNNKISFDVANVKEEPDLGDTFDLIYTERMLINLQTWDDQEKAINYLAKYVKPGGKMIFCECSQQGLEKLNELRGQVGLNRIDSPWHNCYLDDSAMEKIDILGFKLVDVELYSSTYYFLSRVLNAWLAEQEGVQPSYDAPINQLALKLSPMGECAQGKLWVFEKEG